MNDDNISINSADFGVNGSDTSLSTLSSKNSVQESEFSMNDIRELFAIDPECLPPSAFHFPFTSHRLLTAISIWSHQNIFKSCVPPVQ